MKLEEKIAGVAQRSGYIDAAAVTQEYGSRRQTEAFLRDQLRVAKQSAKHHPHVPSAQLIVAQLEEAVERCSPQKTQRPGRTTITNLRSTGTDHEKAQSKGR
jgi:hypothetical protein